jgi:hypothetical protein
MEEKEMTVKEVAEYFKMDEHTIYSSHEMRHVISRDKLARTELIPSLKNAGKWQFKKDVIDKGISEGLLEGVLQNVKYSTAEKNEKK